MSIYIALLLTVMILIVNGSISRSTIEEDAQTITKLREKFINLSPPIVPKVYAERCRLVKECCPTEQENIYIMFADGLLQDKCLTSERKQLPSCQSSFIESEKLSNDPVFLKFDVVAYPQDADRVDGRKKLAEERRKVCSKAEMNMFFCDRNNMKKFKSCISKVLESIAQESVDDDKVYNKYVSIWKNGFISDTKSVQNAFHKNS